MALSFSSLCVAGRALSMLASFGVVPMLPKAYGSLNLFLSRDILVTSHVELFKLYFLIFFQANSRVVKCNLTFVKSALKSLAQKPNFC